MDGRYDRYLREEEERVMNTRELQAAARGAAGHWISALRPWHLYLTLTYDPKRLATFRMQTRDAATGRRIWKEYRRKPGWTPSGDRAKRDVLRWLAKCEAALRRPIGAVLALEYQRNGWPHFHGLADVGELGGHEIEIMGRLWYKMAGGNRISRVWESGAGAVSTYCAKYLNKDLVSGDLVFTDELVRERREFQLPMH